MCSPNLDQSGFARYCEMSAAFALALSETILKGAEVVGVRVLNQGGTTEAVFVLVNEDGFSIDHEQCSMSNVP